MDAFALGDIASRNDLDFVFAWAPARLLRSWGGTLPNFFLDSCQTMAALSFTFRFSRASPAFDRLRSSTSNVFALQR